MRLLELSERKSDAREAYQEVYRLKLRLSYEKVLIIVFISGFIAIYVGNAALGAFVMQEASFLDMLLFRHEIYAAVKCLFLLLEYSVICLVVYRVVVNRKRFDDKTSQYQEAAKKQLEKYSQDLEKTVAERTKELTDTQQRLLKAERLATIGELAGWVGHDLRNPLAAIKNATYYIKTKGGRCTDQQGALMIDAIDKSIDHANKIINDLIEYSEDIPLEFRQCSPQSLVEKALSLTQIPEDIKIIKNYGETPALKVDDHQIQLVFIKIIKNAVDAMPNGGTLDIRSKQSDNLMHFSFFDTGNGITKDVLAKLFTPFSTTKAQGMGFGLAICKKIVDAHNGKIEVASTIGRGTTVTVSLPYQF